MGVDRGRERAHMPREPLRQEKVPRDAVEVRDCRVPQRVEGVESGRPDDDLGSVEREGDPPRDALIPRAGRSSQSGRRARDSFLDTLESKS